jgi:hypothetical protein
LPAGDAGIEKAAAIARALIDGDEFDRGKLFDLRERKRERTIDLALISRVNLSGSISSGISAR